MQQYFIQQHKSVFAMLIFFSQQISSFLESIVTLCGYVESVGIESIVSINIIFGFCGIMLTQYFSEHCKV